MIRMEIRGDGLRLLSEAARALGDKAKADKAMQMGLNKTIGKVNTVVKRAVAKQMGMTQAQVTKRGAVRIVKARPGRLIAEIASSGQYIPLKDFQPAASAAGVRAGPWGKRRVFGGTFLNSGRGAVTGMGPIGPAIAGGHVFKRTNGFNRKSGKHNAIEALWGPSVPVELVRHESAEAFQQIAGRELPVEVERAINVLTRGVVG